MAGLDGVDPVKCSRNVVILPDKSLDEELNKSYEIIIEKRMLNNLMIVPDTIKNIQQRLNLLETYL